jgi:2-C-methyl-D-erythritol 2,4-cyclodiphosphate synthase
VLLAKTYELVQQKGYALVNVDSTILLQAPKIMKYVVEMRNTIAAILHVSPDDVSIKATTTEQLSFIGREEGIVATANIMLRKLSDAKN